MTSNYMQILTCMTVEAKIISYFRRVPNSSGKIYGFSENFDTYRIDPKVCVRYLLMCTYI